MIKRSVFYKGAILLILLLSITVIWNVVLQQSNPPQELVGVLRPEPRSLKSFELVDQKGSSINEQMFKDKWSFVFFGYTSCPDICPTTLHVLNSVTAMLTEKEEKLLLDTQVVFISVDPARDSIDMLADYMAFFNKDFIGATGDKKNIDIVAQQFGAGYVMDEETDPGQYQVSHTSAIFLVAPDTKLVAAFSQPHNPGTIVSQYKKVRSYISR